MKAKIILLFFPLILFSQKTNIIVKDFATKAPIIVQIFSDNGNYIASTNIDGRYEFEKKDISNYGIKKLLFINSDYETEEFIVDEIPNVILLRKIKFKEIAQINLVANKKEYYKVRGYFRSWRLLNNKLVKFTDGIVETKIPYDTLKNKNNFTTKTDNYFISYRNFLENNTKEKNTYIRLSDGILNYSIPKYHKLKGLDNYYKYQKINDSVSRISIREKEKDNLEKGYVIYDGLHHPTEIQTNVEFKDDKQIKILFWKLSGSFKNIEKWVKDGNLYRPSYLFSSKKALIKNKISNQFDNEEVISEIYIDDNIIHNEEIPQKHKKQINPNSSFYNNPYWEVYLIKHPLPKLIYEQITKLKEAQNKF